MTNFNYNVGIPAANNNPSVDQNPMLENFTAINQIIGIDHVSFNTNNGGQHLQVTYNSTSTQSAQTDPQSVAYTSNDSGGHPNNYFKNSQGIFPMSCIKVFGMFTAPASSGSLSFGNQMNIANGTYTTSSSVGTAIINFTGTPLATGTNNTNALVFFGLNVPPGSNPTYTLTSSSITFVCTNNRGPYLFVILQA